MGKFRLTAWVAAAVLSLVVQGASAAEIVLNYWGQFSDTNDREIELIEQFNKLHAGQIRVIPGPLMSTEEMRQKLMVAIAGGAAPDVVKMDRFAVPEWAYKGLFKPLDNFIKRDNIKSSDYFPAAWGELNFQGHMYGLPWDMDVRAYIYNKTVFSEAGIASPPATWDEAEQLGRRLDRMSDNVFSRAGFVAKEGNWFFYGWLLTAGGDIVDSTNRKVTWNSPQGLKAGQFLQDNTAHYGGEAAINKLKTGGLYGAMGNGRIVSTVGGSWFIGSILKAVPTADIGVSAPPRPADLAKEPVSWSGGFSLAIPTTIPSAREEAAWEFIKFFGGKDALVTCFQGSGQGRLPSLRAAMIDPRYRESMPKQMDDFLKLMPYSRFRPVIPGGEAIWKIYRDELEKQIVTNLMPVGPALEQTARLGQQALDEAWAGSK